MKVQFNHLNSSRPYINGSAAVLKLFKSLTMADFIKGDTIDSLLGE